MSNLQLKPATSHMALPQAFVGGEFKNSQRRIPLAEAQQLRSAGPTALFKSAAQLQIEFSEKLALFQKIKRNYDRVCYIDLQQAHTIYVSYVDAREDWLAKLEYCESMISHLSGEVERVSTQLTAANQQRQSNLQQFAQLDLQKQTCEGSIAYGQEMWEATCQEASRILNSKRVNAAAPEVQQRETGFQQKEYLETKTTARTKIVQEPAAREKDNYNYYSKCIEKIETAKQIVASNTDARQDLLSRLQYLQNMTMHSEGQIRHYSLELSGLHEELAQNRQAHADITKKVREYDVAIAKAKKMLDQAQAAATQMKESLILEVATVGTQQALTAYKHAAFAETQLCQKARAFTLQNKASMQPGAANVPSLLHPSAEN